MKCVAENGIFGRVSYHIALRLTARGTRQSSASHVARKSRKSLLRFCRGPATSLIIRCTSCLSCLSCLHTPRLIHDIRYKGRIAEACPGSFRGISGSSRSGRVVSFYSRPFDPLPPRAGEVRIAQGLSDSSSSSSRGCKVPVFQPQAGHPAELCGIGGDQRKTRQSGHDRPRRARRTRRSYSVRTTITPDSEPAELAPGLDARTPSRRRGCDQRTPAAMFRT